MSTYALGATPGVTHVAALRPPQHDAVEAGSQTARSGGSGAPRDGPNVDTTLAVERLVAALSGASADEAVNRLRVVACRRHVAPQLFRWVRAAALPPDVKREIAAHRLFRGAKRGRGDKARMEFLEDLARKDDANEDLRKPLIAPGSDASGNPIGTSPFASLTSAPPSGGADLASIMAPNCVTFAAPAVVAVARRERGAPLAGAPPAIVDLLSRLPCWHSCEEQFEPFLSSTTRPDANDDGKISVAAHPLPSVAAPWFIVDKLSQMADTLRAPQP